MGLNPRGIPVNLQWYDYFRFVTALLALISLYGSIHRARTLWCEYTVKLRRLWWAFNILLFLLLEGSLEQIVTDTPWGPRTLFAFFATVVAALAVFRDEGYLNIERDEHASS